MNRQVSFPSDSGARTRRRRKRELLAAAGLLILVIGIGWLGLVRIGVDSTLLIGLFNLNLVLLLLLLFLVVRNAVKLVLDRRRRVLGSKLRTRLVLAFVTLTLLPTLPMYFASTKFVQTALDSWFEVQVENSMDMALAVGQSYYSHIVNDLEKKADYLSRHLPAQDTARAAFLRGKQEEYGLVFLGLTDRNLLSGEWAMQPGWEDAQRLLDSTFDPEQMQRLPRFWSTIVEEREGDLALGVLPLDEGRQGYLVLGQVAGQGLLERLSRIAAGVDGYKKLRNFKHPLKTIFYLFLAVMTLVIIFGAMWYGFRLAREISAPVQALADGTQRIASGDLGVRLKDDSADELGFLVQSFNFMAEDLEESQRSLERVNTRLEARNQELRERGQYIEAILENVTSGVISLDRQGRISTANHAALALLGREREEVTGRLPLEFLKDPQSEYARQMLMEMISRPDSFYQRQVDVRLQRRNLTLLVSAVGLRNESGERMGTVIVFEDITELQKMQRMAAWQEVAKRIAHEIKNPLTPIKLSAQRLEQKYAGKVNDPVFTQCTGLIVHQVEHMQRMVREFSSFAKLPAVVLEPGRVEPLVNEVVELFRASHPEIEWSASFEEGIPKVELDPGAMRQVLMNLLKNAAEALEERTDGAVAVSVVRNQNGTRVELRVDDNGSTLSAEEKARMFEPYFSRKKGGTGLGLAIVKSIISDHNGSVFVEDSARGGTTFVVDLPAEQRT